uniref:Uncharacterized protein n=1 Tax=Plectus sambesii TaxID=2011161 RepID=A0A914V1I1_9BILA
MARRPRTTAHRKDRRRSTQQRSRQATIRPNRACDKRTAQRRATALWPSETYGHQKRRYDPIFVSDRRTRVTVNLNPLEQSYRTANMVQLQLRASWAINPSSNASAEDCMRAELGATAHDTTLAPWQ